MHLLKKIVAFVTFIGIAFGSFLYVVPINASSNNHQENETFDNVTSSNVSDEELNFSATISDSTVDIGQVVRIAAEFTYNHPDGWESPPQDATWNSESGLSDVRMKINNAFSDSFARPDTGPALDIWADTLSTVPFEDYSAVNGNYITIMNPTNQKGQFCVFWGDRVKVSWDVVIDETFNANNEGESLDLELELWCDSLYRQSRAEGGYYEPFHLYAETTVNAVLNDAVQDSLTTLVVHNIDMISNPLTGSSFVLYKLDGNNNKLYYYLNSDSNEIEWIDILADNPLNAATNGVITNGKTDDNGTVAFPSLEPGNYYIEQIVAPAGYLLIDPDAVAEITVDTGSILDVNAINSTGNVLPETGGEGTALFTMMGVLLMAAAVTLYFTTRRKHHNNNG